MADVFLTHEKLKPRESDKDGDGHGGSENKARQGIALFKINFTYQRQVHVRVPNIPTVWIRPFFNFLRSTWKL